jgi:hypothetical protein
MSAFITRKHIPRRTFLRGAGVVLAMPFLEAMLPAQTPLGKTAGVPKKRFAGIFVPHGAAPGYWSPEKVGREFDFSVITKPLEPFRDYTTIMSGLYSKSAEPPPGETGGDHSVAAAFLCASRPRKTAGADIWVGKTIDQMIAEKVGQDTLLPSIQLGIEDPGSNSGVCGWGYSCAYTNTISWVAPNKPLPMEINPQAVFERLFGDGSSSEERLARRLQDRSILDSLTRKLTRLKADIGASDRNRLNDYLEDIREIERRLQMATKASADVPIATVPFGVPPTFDEHIKLQYDLQALAFQGDITRVSTLLYARDVSATNYPASGVRSGFHGASHHGEDPKRIEEYSRINRYHVAMLAYFIDKLQRTPDGDGTLLDHTVVLYGSNMGNSNQHVHYDVPMVLVGGGCGTHKGGRHIKLPTRTVTTGHLLMSTLGMFDMHPDTIGDSDSPGTLDL